MDYREKIVSDYRIMLGKPTIKGTRITVELILRKLSQGAKIKDLVASYPKLTEGDVLAALGYASDILGSEDVIELSK